MVVPGDAEFWKLYVLRDDEISGTLLASPTLIKKATESLQLPWETSEYYIPGLTCFLSALEPPQETRALGKK